MGKLFLSHSSSDEDLAGAVGRCLKENGVDPIQVSHQIRSAEDWSERIRLDLEACDAALFLVTPNYVQRPWFFMEWAAAWVQDKPPHLLLIDVDAMELPDVMREQQVTSFDGNTERLARNLLPVITDLSADEPRCVTLAGRLVDLISTERDKWAEAKWSRITAAIGNGVAALPDQDLGWVVSNDRVPELMTRLREDFAHPALVHKVARYLIDRGRASDVVVIASLLPGHAQLSIFGELATTHLDVARTIASVAADRETRRECAVVAAKKGLPDLAELIADMTEHAYDRRVIAQQLFREGFEADALKVIDRAEREYEKSNFAMTCVVEGSPEMALEVAANIRLNHELRRIGERLVDHGYEAELAGLVEGMDRNYEKQLLALYAIDRGAFAAAEAVARAIKVSSDLLEVVKRVYDAGQPGLALRLLVLMKLNEERRKFLEYVMEGDRNTAVRLAKEALETSEERRRFAEVLSEAGYEQDAVELSELLEQDEERETLFWFAVAKQELGLADAVLATMEDGRLRARSEAIRAAVTADYDV